MVCCVCVLLGELMFDDTLYKLHMIMHVLYFDTLRGFRDSSRTHVNSDTSLTNMRLQKVDLYLSVMLNVIIFYNGCCCCCSKDRIEGRNIGNVCMLFQQFLYPRKGNLGLPGILLIQ